MGKDLKRILAIPRDERDGDGLVAKWTERLRKPGGEWTLRPAQALALEYIETEGGALLPLTVGGGKTLIGMAACLAAGISAEDTIVLCPAELRDEAEREYDRYSEHFDLLMPEYFSYSMLSREAGIGYLEDRAPKLIVADEAHYLRNKDAARTSRFLKYMRLNECSFIAMSATITNASLHDYAHLAALALEERSPLPVTYSELDRWARIIDVGARAPVRSYEWARMRPLTEWAGVSEDTLTESVRCAFRKRLRSAPGVVVTEGSSCAQHIKFSKIECEIPKSVKEALACARSVWELPGGEEILDPLRLAAKTRQLAQGFYYRFVWPEGEPDIEWLHARSEYAKAVTRKTRYTQYDTEKRVRDACESGEITDQDTLTAYRNYIVAYSDYEEPPTEAVWLSEYLVDDAVKRATEGTILWYEHRCVGEALSERVPTAMAGEPVPDSPIVALSIASHGTGFNLQRYHRNLVLCPPANGGTWHQLIGRTHRAGQQKAVEVEWYGHTPELTGAFASAVKDAKYQVTTLGVENKLITGA